MESSVSPQQRDLSLNPPRVRALHPISLSLRRSRTDQKVCAEGARREVVHAARAVRDVAHYYCLNAGKTLEYVCNSARINLKPLRELKRHDLGACGAQAPQSFRYLKLVVAWQCLRWTECAMSEATEPGAAKITPHYTLSASCKAALWRMSSGIWLDEALLPAWRLGATAALIPARNGKEFMTGR